MSVLISLYFSILLAFSFVSNPVVYCLMLLVRSLCVRSLTYMAIGFSWYLVLFSLVYVGGVYVLFVFVSMHKPNPISSIGVGFWRFFLFLFFFFFGKLYGSFGYRLGFVERSHYLCSFFEGFSYCLFCVVLLLGFVLSRVVLSSKDSFCR